MALFFFQNELTEPVKPCSVSLNDPPDVEKLTANAGCSVFNRTQPEDPKVFSFEVQNIISFTCLSVLPQVNDLRNAL